LFIWFVSCRTMLTMAQLYAGRGVADRSIHYRAGMPPDA
jgi:hypothetical protein